MFYFDGIRVAHRFSFLCCPIMFLYVLSSVLCCSIMCLYVLSSVLCCSIMCLYVPSSVLCCPIMCRYVLSSVLCCSIMCLYVLSSVAWCSSRFPHKTMYSCSQEGSCLSYVICVCLQIVMSNTLCCVFVFFVLCTYVSSFSGLPSFDCPSVFSVVY